MIKRTVFLTGASRGIGKAIYDMLLAKGYHDIIAPTRHELDLSKGFAIDEAYFLGLVAKPDIVINCAGINQMCYLHEANRQILSSMFDINVFAALKIIQTFVPFMKAQKWGRIVNIASLYSIISREGRLPYTMTKFALNGMTKNLAVELGHDNILVNSVTPGFVKTDLTDQNLSSEEQEKIAKEIPIGRFAEVQEIAQTVLFLISEENSYITGQNIIVDGGRISK